MKKIRFESTSEKDEKKWRRGAEEYNTALKR